MSSGTETKVSKPGIDRLGLAIEVAKAGGAMEKQQWDELAEVFGSASGGSLKKIWQNLSKSYVITKKEDGRTPAPKSTKVAKAKGAGKKTKAKAKKGKKTPQDDEEDSSGDEQPKVKKSRATKAKAAKKIEDSEEEESSVVKEEEAMEEEDDSMVHDEDAHISE